MHCGLVYDAKLQVATTAIQAVILAGRVGERSYVPLDNRAAVGALQTGRISSSNDLTQKVRDTVLEARVEIRSIPGLSNILENKEADVGSCTLLSRLPPRQYISRNINLAYQRRVME